MLVRLDLFEERRDYLEFAVFILAILLVSLSLEFYHYTQLKKHKTAIIKAHILNEYTKTTSKKSYKVIKLQSEHGATFYTTASVRFHSVKNSDAVIKIWTSKLNFPSYLKGFYTKGWFLKTTKHHSIRDELAKKLQTLHKEADIARIYAALYLAKPLTYELYKRFSALGISHLFAISGFHLGILSSVILFLLYWLYKLPHKRYFPYRNIQRDIFIAAAIVLFGYVYFLGSPPSLVRAYAMLIVGFILYDRGFEVVSIQTLFVTAVLLIALFPRLFFSLGFWLSVAGVYYILLFLIHFKDLPIWKQFLLIPIWVYLAMLPLSLYIFNSFSLWHPVSILFSILFTLFYPLSLVLHLIGFGDLLDPLLSWIVHTPLKVYKVTLPPWFIIPYALLSLAALKDKKLFYSLGMTAFLVFCYAMLFKLF